MTGHGSAAFRAGWRARLPGPSARAGVAEMVAAADAKDIRGRLQATREEVSTCDRSDVPDACLDEAVCRHGCDPFVRGGRAAPRAPTPPPAPGRRPHPDAARTRTPPPAPGLRRPRPDSPPPSGPGAPATSLPGPAGRPGPPGS